MCLLFWVANVVDLPPGRFEDVTALVYDGSDKPSATEYTATSLVCGRIYKAMVLWWGRPCFGVKLLVSSGWLDNVGIAIINHPPDHP